MSYSKGTRRLSGRLNYREVIVLKEALESAELKRCCCSQASKDEMQNYLATWVAGPIREVLTALQKRFDAGKPIEPPTEEK